MWGDDYAYITLWKSDEWTFDFWFSHDGGWNRWNAEWKGPVDA